jgi:hypothetical protein
MAIEEGAWAICVCISDTGDGGQVRCSFLWSRRGVGVARATAEKVIGQMINEVADRCDVQTDTFLLQRRYIWKPVHWQWIGGIQRVKWAGLSRYSDSLRAGLSGNRIPVGGEIFRTRPDSPWGLSSFLYNGYRVLPGDKAAWAWRPPTPSSAEVKERCNRRGSVVQISDQATKKIRR